MNIKEMNDFDWTSDIKAGETLGNIKLNNFEGYNIGDKITVTGDFYVPEYNGSDQEGWVNVNNEPFIIDDINKQLTRIIIRSINPSFYNDEINKKFLLNYKNQIYVGDTFDDDDKLLISRYIENLKESSDFDWVEDIKYTLGQLVDLGDLSVGDKLILRGNVFNGETHQRTYVDNFEVEIVSKTKYIEGLDGYGMSFSPERRDVVDAMGVTDTEEISFLKQDEDLEVVEHIKSNNKLNEDNDFGWTENVPSEPDFDIWEKVANIIDNEVSQGPNYDSWVGSNSYNELDNILSRYEIDIDDMGDFFTFPPKNKNGVDINHYQIQEILDDLLFNGYEDPNDDYMLESYDPFDFGWAEGKFHLTPEYAIGKRICYRRPENNISSDNLFKYKRYELKLNDVREVDCWVINHVDGDNVVIELESTGEDMDFRYDRVEQLLNLGVWAIMNDDGSIENDFVNPNIKESIKYINNVVKELSILSEDGKTEPDMEWDLSDNIKKDLDRSKKWVKTGEDVKEYVKVLMDKIKSLPKATKKKIIGYALLGMVSVNTINNYISDVEKEKPTDTEIIRSNIKKPAIRKPSYELKQFIKSEEKLRLTAYEIGDDMVTIGYGHAEPTTKTKMIPGKTKITKEKAEKLFEKDIEEASNGLNRILDSWVDQGIDVEITQGMYDAMTSMIFNMGIGNFRMSDFIQMVKRGEYEQAQDTIKTTNVTYPGHKPRREKESEMFGGYYNI
jgi:GH24 family phage-related lysozyme (muramidase)